MCSSVTVSYTYRTVIYQFYIIWERGKLTFWYGLQWGASRTFESLKIAPGKDDKAVQEEQQDMLETE